MDNRFFHLAPARWGTSWAASWVLLLAMGGCGGGGGGSDGPSVNPGAQPPGSVSELGLLVGGTGGAGNVDGVGVQASFDRPQGVALDSELNLYVSDSGNATIRKVTLRGVVTTLAGLAGEKDRADGQGAAARFTRPTAMTRDAGGNLLVVDGESVRRVSLSGAVSTVAEHGTFSGWRSLAVDAAGRFYGVQRNVTCGPVAQVPCTTTEQVKRATVGASSAAVTVEDVPGLMPALAVGGLTGLTNAKYWFTVANDAAGRVAVARLTANGAEGFLDFFLADGNGVFNALTLPEASRRLAGLCTGCTVGSTWSLSAAFEGEDAFRALLTTGGGIDEPLATTVARVFRSGASPIEQATSHNASSADGAFEASGFRGATHIAADSLRRLYIADTGNHTLRGISAQGDARTIAGQAPDTAFLDNVRASLSIANQNVLPLCEVVVAANGADVYTRFCGWLSQPPISSGIPLASRWLHRVTGTATAETYSIGPGTSSYRLRFGVDAANDIYADGRRYGRDGQEKADFNNYTEGFYATGAAVSPQGGVFLSDGRQLRYLAPGASIPVVRGGQSVASILIADVAADAAGNAYVLDGGTVTSGAATVSPAQVKKVSPGGEVTLLAGRADAQGAQDGTGAAATFRNAQGVAVDRRGNVYVADTGNHTVRKVTPAGVVSTLVGVPGQRGTSLGALPGRLDSPTSVAVDANDVLYIATPGAVLKVKLPQ
jgi:hypothetical protein